MGYRDMLPGDLRPLRHKRKVRLALSLNRDFSTIATGATVDSSSAALHATYSYSRKVDFNGTVSAGVNHFQDLLDTGRRDTFFSWDLGVRYRMNEHLQMGAAYNYIKNWSSVSRADYDSQGFSLDISSRY